jgi:hypothetical protein
MHEARGGLEQSGLGGSRRSSLSPGQFQQTPQPGILHL